MAREHIPVAIIRQLRREVGFVCPAPGCSSPYLTWHHFDPPYREGQQHNVNGMIALCAQHHKRADHGAYSSAELRQMKNLGARERPAGDFDFRLKQLVIVAGGGLHARTSTLLRVNGQPVIWLSADEEGRQLLNLDVKGKDGSLLFSMRDNCWEVLSALEDFECPPAAKTLILRAPSANVSLEIRFDRIAAGDLGKEVERVLRQADKSAIAKKKELAKSARIQGAPESFVAGLEHVAPVEKREAELRERQDWLVDEIQGDSLQEEFTVCRILATLPYPALITIDDARISTPRGQFFSTCSVGSGCALDIAM